MFTWQNNFKNVDEFHNLSHIFCGIQFFLDLSIWLLTFLAVVYFFCWQLAYSTNWSFILAVLITVEVNHMHWNCVNISAAHYQMWSISCWGRVCYVLHPLMAYYFFNSKKLIMCTIQYTSTVWDRCLWLRRTFIVFMGVELTGSRISSKSFLNQLGAAEGEIWGEINKDKV